MCSRVKSPELEPWLRLRKGQLCTDKLGRGKEEWEIRLEREEGGREWCVLNVRPTDVVLLVYHGRFPHRDMPSCNVSSANCISYLI